jgi:hypothetical protein
MDFYTSLIECAGEEKSYLQVYWAWGSHLGEAIHKMKARATALGVVSPILVEADPYVFDSLPATAVSEDDGDTYYADNRHFFPPTACYRLPYGVVKSRTKDEYELEDIEAGYRLDELDDELLEVSSVVEEEDLLKVYLAVVGALSEIRVFWVKLQDDWEHAGIEEKYVNEELASLEAIARFIQLNPLNTIQNGHVTLTTYADTGATNVNISDHKTIDVLTYDRLVADKVCEVLRGCGLNEKDDLISIREGFHHWHYKHPGAFDRRGLIDMLYTQGFSYWNPST